MYTYCTTSILKKGHQKKIQEESICEIYNMGGKDGQHLIYRTVNLNMNIYNYATDLVRNF